MDQLNPVMVVIPKEEERAFAAQIAAALGYDQAETVVGPVISATGVIQAKGSPKYLIIDIGDRGPDVMADIDSLAEHCEVGTRVVVLGRLNDVNFYRALKQRGVLEYFPHPVKVADIRAAVLNSGGGNEGGKKSREQEGRVIAFLSAASGDGSSTVAVNAAQALANELGQSAVLIDMDYQFGMIAKNLDLETPYGIKELFEHPDRGIDATLISRMLAAYGAHLKVIGAPNNLRLLPTVRPEVIRDLIFTLRAQHKFIIIDLPHIWTSWVASALSHSDQVILVAQLWLRSVSHAARLLSAMEDIGVERRQVALAINRSGAKFKEAIGARDFERVCGQPIRYYIPNDIKTIVEAENQGKTVLEIGTGSMLAKELRALALTLAPQDVVDDAIASRPIAPRAGLIQSFLRKG